MLVCRSKTLNFVACIRIEASLIVPILDERFRKDILKKVSLKTCFYAFYISLIHFRAHLPARRKTGNSESESFGQTELIEAIVTLITGCDLKRPRLVSASKDF